MSAEEKRFVVLKPGDVLLIGGMTGRHSSQEFATFAERFKKMTGVAGVAFFPGDIQIDAIPAERLRKLAAEADA